MRELDNSIEEAALDLGAGPIKTFFTIILPSIMPAIVSGWLLAFTLSMDDLVITQFVAGPNSSTLPVLVFSKVRRGLNPEINALATIIVFIVSICTFVYWLSRVRADRKRKRDQQMALNKKY
jgi:putrescine transport system permease protein